MRFAFHLVEAVLLLVVASSSTRRSGGGVDAFSTPASLTAIHKHQQQQRTKLHMAFDTTKPSNMFDGPVPLVKERDACGVGFIANTNSGGKKNESEVLL